MTTVARSATRLLLIGAVALGVLFGGMFAAKPAHAGMFTKDFNVEVSNQTGSPLTIRYSETCHGVKKIPYPCDSNPVRFQTTLNPGQSSSAVAENPTIAIGGADRSVAKNAHVLLTNPMFGPPSAGGYDGSLYRLSQSLDEGEEFSFNAQGHTITVKRNDDSRYKNFTITVK